MLQILGTGYDSAFTGWKSCKISGSGSTTPLTDTMNAGGAYSAIGIEPRGKLAWKWPQRCRTGMNCIKIGLPGKLILRKRKGLREVIFS